MSQRNGCTSAGPLRLIFQKSFDEGILHEDWRIANVTLIHKKGIEKNLLKTTTL